MPKIVFEQRVLDRVRAARDRMEAEGRLLPKDTLGQHLERFRAKYGAEVLEGLDGHALLEGMHGRKSKDSLVYWLEFKNDEDFASPPLGSIQGGSALKFGIYQATETGSWMTGAPKQQKVISVEQAVEVARLQQRRELLAGVAVLSGLGPAGSVHPDEADYALLDQKLKSAMPTLYGAGWAHKYLALLFPDRVDDYHSYDYQRFHLVRLLLLPPEGRYAAAQPFITLARALDEPVQRTSAVLNDLHGGPYSYWRVGTVIDDTSGWEGMRQGGYAAVGWPAFGDLTDIANGELDKDAWIARFKQHYPHEHAPAESNLRGQLLDFIRNARQRDVVIAANGQQALGIGAITGPYMHRPDIAPFAHARPVEWRTDKPWVLDEGLQTTFRKLKKPETWLEIERRLFDSTAIRGPVIAHLKGDSPAPAARADGSAGGSNPSAEGAGDPLRSPGHREDLLGRARRLRARLPRVVRPRVRSAGRRAARGAPRGGGDRDVQLPPRVRLRGLPRGLPALGRRRRRDALRPSRRCLQAPVRARSRAEQAALLPAHRRDQPR